MSKVQERWFDWTYDGRGWYLVNDPEVTFYGEEEAMAYCDEHNRNLANESYREGREQAERETVEKIVAWIKAEAAVALWHDMDAFEPDTQEELDTIVAVLEAYADAIQAREWK